MGSRQGDERARQKTKHDKAVWDWHEDRMKEINKRDPKSGKGGGCVVFILLPTAITAVLIAVKIYLS